MKIYLLFALSFLTFNFQSVYAEGTLPANDNLLQSTDELQQLEEVEVNSEGISYDEETTELVYVKNGKEKRFSAWFSIMPPLIAIFLALAFKEVHIALVLGIFFGVFTLNGFQLKELLSSFLQIADTYVLQAIAYTENGELQTGHLSIIIFSVYKI